MAEDIVRVLRLVEYEGPRLAVEDQIRKSIHGTRIFGHGQCRVTAVTLDQFPRILEDARAEDARAIREEEKNG